jgi:hypothetical protein
MPPVNGLSRHRSSLILLAHSQPIPLYKVTTSGPWETMHSEGFASKILGPGTLTRLIENIGKVNYGAIGEILYSDCQWRRDIRAITFNGDRPRAPSCNSGIKLEFVSDIDQAILRTLQIDLSKTDLENYVNGADFVSAPAGCSDSGPDSCSDSQCSYDDKKNIVLLFLKAAKKMVLGKASSQRLLISRNDFNKAQKKVGDTLMPPGSLKKKYVGIHTNWECNQRLVLSVMWKNEKIRDHVTNADEEV